MAIQPDILSWLRRRRERAARIDADARMLVRELGEDGYVEARLKQSRARSAEERRHWRNVALAVAARTGKRVGLDAATRMSLDVESGERRVAGPQAVDAIEELKRLIGQERRPR